MSAEACELGCEGIVSKRLGSLYRSGRSQGQEPGGAGDNVKAPFVARGWDPARFFHYGDFVLLREFRGHGIGAPLFAAVEAHAKAVSDCHFAVICTVVRLPSHPARLADYVPLDGFWARRGFTRRPDLVYTMAWKEVGAKGIGA
jgi:GNAT superfamily N-acetyltransferase